MERDIAYLPYFFHHFLIENKNDIEYVTIV